MPIYEYQCQSCHRVFEFMQRMSDEPMTECQECQGALERLISQSAFHLKGGGWYKDLYSSTKKDASPGASAGGDAPSKAADSSSVAKAGGGEKASSESTASAVKSDAGAKAKDSPAKPKTSAAGKD